MAFNEQSILNDRDFLNSNFNAVTLSDHWDGENLAELIEKIPEIASKNMLGKVLFRVHNELTERTSGLLNFIGGYFQPHRHGEVGSPISRREGFRILRGDMYIVLFDGEGNKKNAIHLDANDENALKQYIIPTGVDHTVVSGSKNTITYELKEHPIGGYNQQADKVFMKNTPKPNTQEAETYFNDLLKWAKANS